MEVHLCEEPVFPFVPLFLIPEVASLLIETDGLGSTIDIIHRPGGGWGYHLVVIAKGEPPRAGDTAGEIDTIVVSCASDALGVGIFHLIEIMGPSTGFAIECALIVAHGIMDSSHIGDTSVKSSHSQGEEAPL